MDETKLMSEPRRRTRLWVGGSVALALALAVGGFLAVRAFLRPSVSAAAAAMPPETSLYAGLDWLQLLDADKLARFAAAIPAPLAEADLQFDREGIQAQLDAELEQRYDFNFSDDIASWLGRTIGAGIVEFKAGEQGQLTSTAGLLAVEVRNKAGADAFLQKVLTQIEQDTGRPAQAVAYEGTTYYQTGAGDEMIGIGRNDNLFLVAVGLDAMHIALDSLHGKSLADNADFKDVVAALPTERALTFYAGSRFFPELSALTANQMQGLALNTVLSVDDLAALRGAAVGVGLVEEGISLDGVSLLDPDKLPAERAASAAVPTAGALAGLMPADTILLINGGSWEALWRGVRQGMVAGASEADFADAMQAFEQSLGFNPDVELFPYLTGELGLALIPAAEGLITQQTGLGLGALIASGIEDPAALAAVGDKFQTYLEQIVGLPVITKSAVENLTLYQTNTNLFKLDLAYGVTPDYFFLGTAAADVQALTAADGSRLPSSPLYARAQDALQSRPAFYLDLHGLMGAFPEDQDMQRLLSNVPLMAAAGNSDDTGSQWRLLIFLDAPEQ